MTICSQKRQQWFRCVSKGITDQREATSEVSFACRANGDSYRTMAMRIIDAKGAARRNRDTLSTQLIDEEILLRSFRQLQPDVQGLWVGAIVHSRENLVNDIVTK